MSTGADNKTMPVTAAYEDGYDRIFGKDHKPQRGRFFWDAEQHKFVPEAEYQAPVTEQAISAPIMVDRFMEGSVATDGTDISSRRKREEYKRRTGVTDASDYKPGWTDRVRARNEAAASQSTQRTVAEVARMNPRHLRKYLEEKK
jgi:hypothetical protein